MTRPEFQITRCVHCVLPQTYPGLQFDDAGVCNQCREYREPTLRGADKLAALVEPYRGSGKSYDCIVALSGGRDSTYALYYAVKQLGLRALAFSVDNGCMPTETQANVRNATEILKVDLVTVRHDLVTSNLKNFVTAWMRRPTAEMIASICLGCRYGLKKSLLEASAKHKIKLFIAGDGEPEKSFAKAMFLTKHKRMGRRLGLVWGQLRELLLNPSYLRHPSLVGYMFLEYLYAYSPPSVMRVIRKWHGGADWLYVPLFKYIPWDEAQIMSTITKELKWQQFSQSRTAWRSDCTVNLIKNYFYGQTLGFTKNDELVSNMIRQGMLTRTEGIRRLENDNQINSGFVADFCQDHGIEFDEPTIRRRIAAQYPSGWAAHHG